jgi:hypothetical protein
MAHSHSIRTYPKTPPIPTRHQPQGASPRLPRIPPAISRQALASGYRERHGRKPSGVHYPNPTRKRGTKDNQPPGASLRLL